MKVVTFQSSEVVGIVMKEGVYYPRVELQREKNDYEYERSVLGGYNPVWFFRLDTRDFTTEDFTDGYFLNLFKCEMSLGDDVGEALSQFKMIEMDVQEDNMFLGKTRNCCRLAYVTNKITYDMVRAIYHVCEQKDEDLWYYPKIVPVKILKDNVLFKEEFTCHKVIPRIIRTGMRY